jgi:integrase
MVCTGTEPQGIDWIAKEFNRTQEQYSMAKPSKRMIKPWQRGVNGKWYVTIEGKQISLGTDKAKAFAEFHKIMVAHNKGFKTTDKLTIGELAELWLADREGEVKEKTLKNYRMTMDSFCETCGSILLADIQRHHVAAWIKKHRWSQSTECLAITIVKALMSWADDMDYIDGSTLHKLKRPKMQRRDPITVQDAATVISLSKPNIQDALKVLLVTGVRPGELVSMTAPNIDFANRSALVKGKMGKREIFMPQKAVDIIRPMAEARPEGPLFISANGKPLTVDRLHREVAEARRKGKLGDHVTPHCFRGLFSTEALRNGVDSANLISVTGHTDPKMLVKHYAAPDDEMKRDVVDRATQSFDKILDSPPAPSE